MCHVYILLVFWLNVVPHLKLKNTTSVYTIWNVHSHESIEKNILEYDDSSIKVWEIIARNKYETRNIYLSKINYQQVCVCVCVHVRLHTHSKCKVHILICLLMKGFCNHFSFSVWKFMVKSNKCFMICFLLFSRLVNLHQYQQPLKSTVTKKKRKRMDAK